MKFPFLLAVGFTAAALATALPAVADDAHHPAKADPPAAVQAKAPPEQTVKKMQGNVKKMQAQLERLGKAKNEADAQAILAEHMQTMHENMMLGRGMAGMDCQMMGGNMMGGGMHGMMGGEGSGHEAMMQRMQQMEKRMDAMQSRMDQVAPTAGK